MVCHDLPNVFAVADRIVVMRLGEIRAVHNTSETSYEEDIAEIAGVGGSGTTPSRPCERASRARMPIARTPITKAHAKAHADQGWHGTP